MMKCPGSLRSRWMDVFLKMHLVALLLVVAGVGFSSSGASLNSLSPDSKKVQVSDPALARQIVAHGGKLIADYGGYQLYELPKDASRLLENTRAQVHEEYDVIELHSQRLNTRTSEARALSKAVGNFTGKHLHLVQF